MESFEPISVASTDLQEDRFSRLRLIGWWDQEKLARMKVLVVGAGALGNEIVKNLALLGFRQMLVVDLDNIEHSNLSRSILFRPANMVRARQRPPPPLLRASSRILLLITFRPTSSMKSAWAFSAGPT